MLRLFFLIVCLTVMQTAAEDATNGDQQLPENPEPTEPETVDLNFNTRWQLDDEEDNLIEDDAGTDDQDSDRIQNKRFLALFRNRPPKSEGYKRGPGFRSWGGKRGEKLFEGGKRRPFQSWGGKRSYFDDWLAMQEKRKFSSWGGKRSNNNNKKKPSFTSWGGKRSYESVMN